MHGITSAGSLPPTTSLSLSLSLSLSHTHTHTHTHFSPLSLGEVEEGLELIGF